MKKENEAGGWEARIFTVLILAVLGWAALSIHGAQHHVNYGATANDHSGDPLRVAFSKIESNFNELYQGIVITNLTVYSNLVFNLTNLVLGTPTMTNPAVRGTSFIDTNSGGSGAAITFNHSFSLNSLPDGTVNLVQDDTGYSLLTLWSPNVATPSRAVTQDYGHPGLNVAARLYDMIYASEATIPTNATLVIDPSATTNMFLCSTQNGGYNINVRFTNLYAGQQFSFDIFGPAGSNAITWIWPPGCTSRWPCDAFSDLPVTNNYMRTNTHLVGDVRVHETNNIAISARAFK